MYIILKESGLLWVNWAGGGGGHTTQLVGS